VVSENDFCSFIVGKCVEGNLFELGVQMSKIRKSVSVITELCRIANKLLRKKKKNCKLLRNSRDYG